MSFKGEAIPINSVLHPEKWNGENSIFDFAIMIPDWEKSPFEIINTVKSYSFPVPEYLFPP
jgi:hypothetical protein